MNDSLIAVLSVLFAVSLLALIIFHIREGKDERGRIILTRAYSAAFAFLLLAVLSLLLLPDWSHPNAIGTLTLKDALFLSMCLSGIVAGVSLLAVRMKY